jgi:hypothetical protein
MKTSILISLGLLLMACGDNKGQVDARQAPDGPPADARCSDCPAPPALGTTQIDRMGRPAVNTALNHAFTNTGVTAAKDMYNADKDIATWQATWTPEIMKNAAIIDVLDGGICGNGLCETTNSTGVPESNATCPADCSTTAVPGRVGCGNQVLYNGNASGGGAAAATSYQTLSGILANDELYVDTSKTTCAFYLAVEFGVATGLGNTTCGGRAPQYDVIDFSYTALALGIRGFSTDGLFTPGFGDGVTAHTDLTSTFPFLGEPH